MRPRRLTTEIVAQRAKAINGNKFGYERAVFRGLHTKMCIICRKHGEFWQTPANHLYQRQGCPECKANGHRLTQSEFLERARKRHGHRFNYSKTIYRGMHTKIVIICKRHGKEFSQTPIGHLQGDGGCPTCWREGLRDSRLNSLQEFLDESQRIHGKGTYDYSKTVYRERHEKVTIICREHGEFEQEAGSHLWGSGCPGCCNSRGELAVALCLEGLGESFVREARIIPGRREAFDFHLPERKVLIEFHGQHHYFPVRFGGMSQERAGQIFPRRRQGDRFKARWARKNGLRLIVIPYTVKDVAGFLANKLTRIAKAA